MYVREYFEEEARQSAKSMVKDIRDVFDEILGELEWMDEETRYSIVDELDINWIESAANLIHC